MISILLFRHHNTPLKLLHVNKKEIKIIIMLSKMFNLMFFDKIITLYNMSVVHMVVLCVEINALSTIIL